MVRLGFRILCGRRPAARRYQQRNYKDVSRVPCGTYPFQQLQASFLSAAEAVALVFMQIVQHPSPDLGPDSPGKRHGQGGYQQAKP